ncbi:hypothetical protein FJQ54_16270 [Sandaracinobacter neustonicus]|uniref:Transcription factor n=1 Tax=Sandaracinobacter neustonicus TaxID=1715348 RepID=A0A501XDS6_9SPHN|nr:hypothetical protein [Sandaracinobacter neustonicus]TPE58609.1 hypothetical protein FJQ54_16270 [Sandaracinobacter neustonicus]
MGDQIHIRDGETAGLLRLYAAQTGRTMRDILREAVRGYKPEPKPERSLSDLDHLLKRDWAQLKPGHGTIEDMYDDQGLPI